MDSAALLALAVIVGVPAVYLAARIWVSPFTGLCLWVLLLPVTKTIASLMGYPFGEGPIVLQKLTLADPVLLLTAVAGWLGASGSAGALSERQGRCIVGLFAAFCTVGILSATLGPTGSESLIEVATYVWLCVSLVVICRLLGTRERARRVLSAWRWAGVVACAAGGAATVLLWRGNLDNLLVQGGRVAGLFEGINQLQSFMMAVIPYVWLCVSLVVICRLLGTRERARRVLSAWRWAGVVACAAGGAATVLLWRGNLDNLLVQGGRVAGLFEGINQLQSFMMAVIPFLWLCVSLVVICRLLGTRERARRVLSAWRWAGVVACAAGGAATVLLWRGNLDNLLVQGGRVAGLFEGINQLQSFMMAVIPFL